MALTKLEMSIATQLMSGLITAALLRLGRENPDFWDLVAAHITACNRSKTPQMMKKVFENLSDLVRSGPHGRAARAFSAVTLRGMTAQSTDKALEADQTARDMLRLETQPSKEQFKAALDPILDYRRDVIALRVAADLLERDIVEHLDAVKGALDRNSAMGATMCMLQGMMHPGQDSDSNDDDGEDGPCH